MRALAVWMLALGLVAPPVLPATGKMGNDSSAGAKSDTNKDAAAKTKTGDTPAASPKSDGPSKAEAASMELELQQLRDLLEMQAKQLQEQNEQLKEQQRKMQVLEEQLNAASASRGTATGASGAASSSAVSVPSSDKLKAASTPPESFAAAQPAASSGARAGELKASDEALEVNIPRESGQTGKEKVEEKLSDLAYGKVKIGGVFYGDWAYYTNTGFGPQFLTQLNQDGPNNSGFNSFDITRTYLNFFYTPNDAVTLRLTPNIYRQVDVSKATGNGSGSAISSSSNGNLGFRLKYAYVDFNTLFTASDAFKNDKLTVGQTTNPLVDWEEGLYGYRYVNLVPWNYLSLSSTYTGVTLHGPIEFNGKEYLDYHIGVFNTASFHAIETNDKKQGMARLTWYPLGTTSDRTGLGVTGFEDYGYNTKTPDAKSTPLNRLAVLLHYQSHSKGYLFAGEYDLGRNAFSAGNLFSGAGPADEFGLGPTQFATFDALADAILAGKRTRQQGFDFFGHVRLGHSPFSLFGMYERFQPNTKISGTNPLDFERIVGGISYKYNDHFEFSFDDQNLNYYHDQFTMSPAQIATFSKTLAAANPNGIPSVVPDPTNAFFINLQFTY